MAHNPQPINPNRSPQDPHISLGQPVGSMTFWTDELPPVAPYIAPLPPAVKRPRSVKRILKRIALVLLAILLSGLLWVGWKVYNNIARATGDRNPLHLFSSVTLKSTDNRTNVLLAGYSDDDPGHSGATLTDSIMVISINNTTNTAQIISVPRDLWVHIPGDGYQKINAAYTKGEQGAFSQAGYPSGGMGMLESIVSTNLGIPIHYYALINYTAFKDAVNAVGGIQVDLTSPDNPYGLYDPYTNLKLPNGKVTLDGQTALNLARSRGDGPGAYGFPRADFNRTEHQRQMLIALMAKATSGSVITNPLKIGQLADAAGNNVKTDMQNSEAESLYVLGKKINPSTITSAGLNDINGKNLLASYTSATGQSALIPAAGVSNYTAIQAAVHTLLYPQPAATSGSSTNTGSQTPATTTVR